MSKNNGELPHSEDAEKGILCSALRERGPVMNSKLFRILIGKHGIATAKPQS